MEKRKKKGRRVGETHHAARLTDDEIDLVRDLHESEVKPLGYRRLAWIFQTTPATIQKICTYRRRTTRVA
jgi:hypothetical protein